MVGLALGLAVPLALMPARSALAAAADSCPAPPGAEAALRSVVASTNASRRAHGLPALEVSPALTLAARRHACDMVRRNYFSHRSPDGAMPRARVLAAGCRPRLTAENIAGGFADAGRTMELWLGSAKHLENILRPGVSSIGVAVASPMPGQAGGPRWVQVFAAGC